MGGARWLSSRPATILLLLTEVDRENAWPSKVLTTERLVFVSDDYEIESGQGNDTASVQRGRQTERPAVESPHDREARLFQRRFRGERARQRRTTHYRSVLLFSGSFTAT